LTLRQRVDGAILIVFTALTRFAFRSHYLYDIDSVNFALALKRFDPSVHQPHPPGYFLYICLGRLVNLVIQNANSAFVAISIVFSCGAAAMVYLLADKWFCRNAAVFAALIFVFSPLTWFHGTVALTYIVEAFFSALTGYLCWRAYSGEVRFLVPAAVVVGVAAGFRASTLLLLGPVLVVSFCRANRKQAAVAGAALILTLLAWFIPMIEMAGGAIYFSSLLSLWLAVPSRGTLFNSTVINSVARVIVIVGIYFLCFGCAAVLPVLGHGEYTSVDRRKKIFALAWIAPGLLFFTFVYLKFVNSGYLLLLVPPVCIWMGRWASTWYSNSKWRRSWKMPALICCAGLNTLIFVYAPFYCSYREVRRFEADLENIIHTVPRIASPRETMIVGLDSHFLGYRHAGYYLPGYLTVEFPEVRLTSGTRVFAMKDRDTHLESVVPASSFQNFIIFPLPLGDREYSDYMAVVRKRFPPGDLRTLVRGGREYDIGPVADLSILFPVCSPPRGPVVHGR